MTRFTNELRPIQLNESTGRGPYLATDVTGWTFSPAPAVTDADLIGMGTKAISITAPNNPSFSLPRAIGELKKDGLPSPSGTELWKEKSNFLKGSGSEYLNLEFAWKPLVSDVRRFANSVTNHKKIMDGYIKGGEQKTRRRFVYTPVRSSKSIVGGCFLVPSTPTRNATGSTTVTEESQSWFSGAFKYHVPIAVRQGELLDTHYAYAKKLLGVRLTPDTLWELAPWSWAADWFANTGDIVTNISNLGSDGLVMQYGYMMSSYKQEKTTSFQYGGQNGYQRFTTERKKRIPASPYGFASTFDGLSTRQAAICAALGITRVR